MPAKKIPPGYTFLNPEKFISEKGKAVLEDLLQKADKRDPDNFDMYIYNDFFNYGVLDLVDKTLSTLHTKIVKKDWNEAMSILEALTLFMNTAGNTWPMIDDGERTEMTNTAYGALLITLFKRLKTEDMLDTTHFPALETVLREATKWGRAMNDLCKNDYFRVTGAMGKRLFKNKIEAEQALEKERLNEWIAGLGKEDKEMALQYLKEMEEEDEDEDEEDAGKPWWHNAKEEDEETYIDDDDFVMSRAWKAYKEYLAECPTKPMVGPAQWDLSKWSKAQKAQFEFANMD